MFCPAYLCSAHSSRPGLLQLYPGFLTQFGAMRVMFYFGGAFAFLWTNLQSLCQFPRGGPGFWAAQPHQRELTGRLEVSKQKMRRQWRPSSPSSSRRARPPSWPGLSPALLTGGLRRACVCVVTHARSPQFPNCWRRSRDC